MLPTPPCVQEADYLIFFFKKLKCFEIFVHLAFTQHINVILIANR